MKIGQYVVLFVIFFILWQLYFFLEENLGDNWITVGIFFAVLMVGRIGLFLYRRSKGIHDEYMD